MDSGNSASMQSSSGADEEYDSRAADSIMAAFLTNPPTNAGSFAGNFHPPPQSSPAAVFDHFSTLFDPRTSLPNQNPILNFDMAWSGTDRSHQIPPDLAGPPSNSAAANHNLSSVYNFSGGVQNFSHPPDGTTNSFRPTDHTELQNNIPNNCGGGGLHPKKRPRASRRAPTTVLTTNTTNFRAMVQEFTGIPAPPFTASSPFTRNAARFDLFARKAAHLEALPSSQTHLLRPFPQKPRCQSPTPSTTFLAGGNSQNPIFDINNMFQSNPKIIPSSNHQNNKMGIFEEFCQSSHGHCLPPAGQALQSTMRHNINNNNGNNPPPASWVVGGGESNQQGGVNLRSGHGNINGKFIRYATGTANSSGFFGNKVVEDLRAREGMVEPWICSSD